MTVKTREEADEIGRQMTADLGADWEVVIEDLTPWVERYPEGGFIINASSPNSLWTVAYNAPPKPSYCAETADYKARGYGRTPKEALRSARDGVRHKVGEKIRALYKYARDLGVELKRGNDQWAT